MAGPGPERTLSTTTLVIGASAAGLAVGAQLQARAQEFAIVEAQAAVAGTWRGHYDRLHLHTPRSSSALPGLPMPRTWGRYPSRDQVVDYLEAYRRHFGLRPHLGQRAIRVERVEGCWQTTTSHQVWRSTNVVVATGRARLPARPTWPGMVDFAGAVLHSSEFRTGAAWRDRRVLVVGFGNSACEIALDLLEHGATVHMSVRSAVNVLPRDVFGAIPVLQLGIVMRLLPPRWADALAWPVVRATMGDITGTGLRKLTYGPVTQITRYQQVPLLDIGTLSQLRAGRLTVHPGIEAFSPDGVVFSDASTLGVDCVVLATGYRAAVDEFLADWPTVCDPSGTPMGSGGPCCHRGLYFCGMRVSPAGMLREIGIEARRLGAYISASEHE